VLRCGTSVKETAGYDSLIKFHRSDEIERISVETKSGGYESHGGADWGLMAALYEEMRCPHPDQMRSSLQASIQSHLMGFAAEESRKLGLVIPVQYMRQQPI